MRNYLFPDEQWVLVNEKDFVYSQNAVEVLEQFGRNRQTEELLEAGFLRQYATTTLENDFNEFSAWLFSRETELCDLRAQYGRIEKKAGLAINFFHSIDPNIAFLLCK